ncbi:hypothetical protein [Bacillus infantis]|uniref:hypothetical protein n=1 Tax=Bacillus infantis TaxID=324767 RepID=UPI003CE7844E
MTLKSYPAGTTVRLHCTFYDFDNEKVDPSLLKVLIRNYQQQIVEQLTPTKKITGEYYLDYITPNKPQTVYYEWYGEIDGLPSIKRDGFVTKFM